jgi:hypothetical protein
VSLTGAVANGLDIHGKRAQQKLGPFSFIGCFVFLSWRYVEAAVGGVVAVGHFLGGVDLYLFNP